MGVLSSGICCIGANLRLGRADGSLRLNGSKARFFTPLSCAMVSKLLKLSSEYAAQGQAMLDPSPKKEWTGDCHLKAIETLATLN